VKQAKDDPSKHVGDGTMTLAVGSDRRVSGSIDSGPASPAVIEGSIVGSELRGGIRRKDPKDDGLTGTFTANAETGAGTMSLADSNGVALREGKLTLKKK
jgi:hypothetical protein